MRYEDQEEARPSELEKSVIDQFHGYLREVRRVKTLAVSSGLSWWDN